MRIRKKEAGQALVFAALGLVALLGFMGLGIDMGYIRYQRGRMHAAADAAAIAGAADILFADVTSAAKGASAANNFTDGSNGVTVTVNHGPVAGPHAGDPNYVETIVSQNQPTFFMSVLGVSTVPLSARSVAKGSSPNCIYALGNSGTVLNVAISNVTSPCGIIGNSNLNGSGFLSNLSAPYIGVHGTSTNVNATPAASTGIPVVADPLANLPAPTDTDPTCTAHPTKTTISSATTLNPGTYCGGIKVNFLAAGGSVTFNPGVYILKGGGFQMTDTFGEKIIGNGVTFYNTGTSSGSCNTCYGPITTLFTSGASLAAPTAGTYAGILLFQDKNNTQTAAFNANFSFGTAPFLTGTYYFPNSPVQFNFNFGKTAAYTLLVAKSVSWLVTFDFNNDYSTLPGGSPIKNTGVLVE